MKDLNQEEIENSLNGDLKYLDQIHVEADAEVVSLAYNAYRLLGLEDVKIQLNSLGDTESRNNYREALIKYFEPHIMLDLILSRMLLKQ